MCQLIDVTAESFRWGFQTRLPLHLFLYQHWASVSLLKQLSYLFCFNAFTLLRSIFLPQIFWHVSHSTIFVPILTIYTSKGSAASRYDFCYFSNLYSFSFFLLFLFSLKMKEFVSVSLKPSIMFINLHCTLHLYSGYVFLNYLC